MSASQCEFGHDCSDCGPREYRPPPPSPGAPPSPPPPPGGDVYYFNFTAIRTPSSLSGDNDGLQLAEVKLWAMSTDHVLDAYDSPQSVLAAENVGGET